MTTENMPAEKRAREIYKVTIIGSIGNFLLVIFKFIAGIVGHSNAMLADAVHSLSDFATDVIVLLFVRISSKPQDKNHDFGHGKYETLATAIIGIILFGVGVGILWKSCIAIWDWAHGSPLEAPGWLALIAALVSLVIKEILYQYTVRVGKKIGSQVVVANAWHHRSDALSSIGTTIGIAGAIFLGEHWRVLDPIAAAVVSFFIMKVAYKLVVPCAEELMEKSLPEEVEANIEKVLVDVLSDCDPHNLRTRHIGNRNAMDVHVRMDANMTVGESHKITQLMEERLRALLGPDAFIYIHVEPRKDLNAH